MKLSSYATFALAVMVTIDDEDVANDLGYKRVDKFKEGLRAKVVQAIAEMPRVVSIDVSFADGIEGEALEELLESMEEEGED